MNPISTKKISSLKNIIIKFLETGYLQVFIINFLIAMAGFIGLILKGDGIFTLANDFNEQQIPFHMLANSSLKNGSFLWNWNIDLGSSFAGALGFYVLGSPFAWLSFLFPAKLYPYLVGWLYMMKYATAGALSYGYIKIFTNKKYAVLCSILYAFSGFQCANLIFHHFHDAVAFFPLMLIGYEKLVKEGKKGWLALGVCINAFVNYYFFIQEVIFLIIYFLCREGINIWKKRKLTGHFFIEGILGVGMAGILFFPSVLFTMQNPRITRMLPINHWLYSGNRDFLQVIRTLLFPGELMCSQSCIKEYDWSSWSAYLPMVGLTLVLSFILKNRKSWITRILVICMIATGIPILNSVFGMFSDTNYHRWLFMLVLVMSLASALVMEDRAQYPLKRVSLIIGIFMIFMTVGFYWWSANKFQLIYQPEPFLIWSVVGIAGVSFTGIIALICRKEKSFYLCMLIGITGFSIFTTGYTAELYHRISDRTSQEYYDRIMAFQDIKLPDSRYRIASDDNTLLMTASLPGTGSFTSMVNGSIYEFYEALGLSRPVFTPEGPEGLRALVGGKFYLSAQKENDRECLQTVYSKEKKYYLYEYDSAVPIGSAYDYFMTESQFGEIPKELRAIAMLKCIIVPDDEKDTFKGQMEEYDWNKDGNLSVQDVKTLVDERCKEASDELIKKYNGFQSTITVDKNKYAFFSVPYDKGFSAYVNGKAVEILKTNGMMAIPLVEGENIIVFQYRNYDLLTGVICSLFCFTIWGRYRKNNYNDIKCAKE